MSAAREALDAGRLAEALGLQRDAVRSAPAESASRLFFVELLILAGELADARRELDAIVDDSPTWPAARRHFRTILRAESRRFPRLRRPEFVPSPPPRHVRCRWNAAVCQARGHSEAALNWLDRADQYSPEIAGFVDGREFRGLRDSDDRFATLLEFFFARRGFWIAWEQVRSLRLEPAEHLLDVAVRAATLTRNDGVRQRVSVPLLYPGSSRKGDDLALGQAVDWTSADAGLVCGLGAKVLTFGDDELALSSCTMIEIRQS